EPLRASCAAGERLLFLSEGSAAPSYLAAYAEPVDGGERIWYFPSRDGHSPELEAHAPPTLFREAVLVGNEHRPGHYRVTVVLSNRPLSRDEVLATPDSDRLATQILPLEVLP